jgi:hypothetical protein
MKLLKWVAIFGIVGVCVVLLASKDDIRRMREMRQM